MSDIFGLYFLVFLCLVGFAVLSGLCIFVARKIKFGNVERLPKLRFIGFLKAIIASMVVALIFPFLFTFSVGYLIGPSLGLAMVYVVATISLAVTLVCFSYFLSNGVPGWR